MRSDLLRLVEPFKPKYVKKAPQGKHGDYVPHDVVTQKLLAIVGPFDFHVKEIVRNLENGQVEAVICALTCTIDGKETTVEEVGDCEIPSNWKTEGGRLKDAISDALKRCAMRLGVGLHLWSGNDFDLFTALQGLEKSGNGTTGGGQPTATAPSSPSEVSA